MNDEFYNAAIFGEMAALREMLAADPALLHARDKWGFTALHGVVGEENVEVAEFLLQQGADPNAQNDEGLTPLHLAAYPEMVDVLVRHGADVNARTEDGRTPLLVQAEEAERCEVMAALLRLGADPRVTDPVGQTALEIAEARDEEDKVLLLRGHRRK